MSAKKIFPLLALSLVALITLTLASCGGGGGSGSSGDGTLKLYLTDNATQDYRAVYVTIDRVDVHRADGNWEVVANPQTTYNLLELVNGVTVVLGEDQLPAGDYTQMRLMIGNTPDDGENIAGDTHQHANYLLSGDNLDVEPFKKIPSGQKTGIKIVGGFTINTDKTTELLLDFDAMRSVVKLGKSGNNNDKAEYLLKPTIKVLDRSTEATVNGTITKTVDTEPEPLAGAFVSAQSGDPLQIQAGTISNDKGKYRLFLEQGSYTLVTTADGYLPTCRSLSLISGDQRLIDFNLTAAAISFDLSGTVTVAEPGENERVVLTFYQTVACNDDTTAIVVVRELNFDADADGIGYQLSLPTGNYRVVATHVVLANEEEIVESTIARNIILNNHLVEDFNF